MDHKGLLKSYIIGFIFSIILTMLAYLLVYVHISMSHTGITHEFIIPILLVLAVVQLFVQLIFFLHMGREKKPRMNLSVFIAFISLILLIAISSLWIMDHLNYNMMPQEMEKKILDDELMEMPGHTPEDMHEHTHSDEHDH